MNCFNAELIQDIDVLENDSSPKEEHVSVDSEYEDEYWQNVHDELDQMNDYDRQIFWEFYDSAFKPQG
jgi:hypothetical protein